MSEHRADLRKRIDNWFRLHKDEMISDLGRLIAINSVRGPAQPGMPYGAESRAVLDLAKAMLEQRGFKVDVFEDMIITADLGPAPPQLGILCHLDVVAAGTGWDSDPFTMTIKDGKIYGRGATDNKGPCVAAMYAMYCARELCPELKHGFRLLMGSGEESGCEDIAQYIAKIDPPPAVFTPDADFPIVNTEKGRLAPTFIAEWSEYVSLPRVVSITGGTTRNMVPELAEAVVEGFELGEVKQFCRKYSEKTGAVISAKADGKQIVISAVGRAAHAARPDNGLNAQTALIEMLAAMPFFADSAGTESIRALNRLFPHGDLYGKALGISMSDELTGPLTVNFGVLSLHCETGFTGNFDSRTPECADSVDILGITREAFEREGFTMTSHDISKSHHTPEDSALVQTLLRLYEEYTGLPGSCLSVGGQTYAHNIPGGVAFGTGTHGVNNGIHSANEFIGEQHLLMCAKMFTQAILDMCGA